jgi:hypothetical protein
MSLNERLFVFPSPGDLPESEYVVVVVLHEECVYLPASGVEYVPGGTRVLHNGQVLATLPEALTWLAVRTSHFRRETRQEYIQRNFWRKTAEHDCVQQCFKELRAKDPVPPVTVPVQQHEPHPGPYL